MTKTDQKKNKTLRIDFKQEKSLNSPASYPQCIEISTFDRAWQDKPQK